MSHKGNRRNSPDSDPYEEMAKIAFGIGLPIVVGLFALILFLLK